ncbi:MAG: DNA gyrase subunit A [Candidatus Coatesbacteria bacterium RBG_13_66_14]|uniref:DNA gyrase subunit A n=1 Tax=Candidatus Coatesbacteria bacterium RBG_13_66_14 TaxID=1817816 RepID=A0A1F5F538_9BACT|nr:MAG: DNA gyrase subunit A [Candidatus Coatesbacteria bacterium RBG_13_66_14]
MTLREQSIQKVSVDEEMRRSYLSYAMSVIVGRALPDVRDGLKPVHRRLIYAMQGLGLASNKPHRKAARIVGEAMGKFHPHGDQALYDTLVGLGQDFTSRYPLVDPQGNFGSLDGDPPAAMRYTEARLSKLAEEMLADIESETVDFVPNFDASLNEPVVLPSRIPNLLVNGSTGIAVGMASHMPPHNLGEVCRALVRYIADPGVSLGELMQLVPGPDFPTGGVIMGREGLLEAYATGRGKLTVRGRTTVEESKKGKTRIVITEIPYQVNKSRLVEQIADLVRSKTVDGVTDLRDESDRRGVRVVVELKKEANPEIILNHLYRHTQLQTTFGVINLALVGGEPQYLSLTDLLGRFVEHRIEVVERRSRYELDQAKRRAHIVEGLLVALGDMDRIVATLRSSPDTAAAQNSLMNGWSLSEPQAKAILEMRLSRLVALEHKKLADSYDELTRTIARLEELLGDRQMIKNVIKEELTEVANKYSDERRTGIVEGSLTDMEATDLIADESALVALTREGYVKRMQPDTYRAQGRGGVGITGIQTKEEDFVEQLFIARTHDHLLCFTTDGRCYWLKIYQIPEASRLARGTAIVNLLELDEGEKITAVVPVRDLDDKENYLVMATARGMVKKTELSAFANPRKGGIIAIGLGSDDRLIGVRLTDGRQHVLLATRNGRAVRFAEVQTRPMGRAAGGVIGIRLTDPEDAVVGMAVVDPAGGGDSEILVATAKGYGKRTPLEEYPLKNRGGLGVINIKTTLRNGPVVFMRLIGGDEELLLISEGGMVIRYPASEVSVMGRNTQGVRLMRFQEGDALSAVAVLVEEAEEEEKE